MPTRFGPIRTFSILTGLTALLAAAGTPVDAQQGAGQATTNPSAQRPQVGMLVEQRTANPLPRVHLFATGGTISNSTHGRLTVDELIQSAPNVTRLYQVSGEQFSNIASSELTLDQWLELSRRINERFRQDPGLSGIVVTSGTDTLEELAYFLHLTVRDARPCVIVGSMRNPSTLGYEGPANLEDAFKVAAHPASRGIGALVVMNDQIHSAREVTKTDARLLNTFNSRDVGELGTVFDMVQYVRKPVKRHTATSEFDVSAIKELPRVDVILTYQGAPGDLITAAIDNGAKGIVMATAGAGATSGTQADGISYAIAKGAFVVTTTRTGGGSIAPNTRPSLQISGDDLQPVKARVLLMLALATTSDPVTMQRMFREY